MKTYPPEQLLRVIQIFLGDPTLTKEAIAKQVNKDFRQHMPRLKDLTRQDIYKCISSAVAKGLLQIAPRPELELAGQLTRRFNFEPGSIHVVPATYQNCQFVAALAAERVAKIIVRHATHGKKTVGLGLGSGSATLDFCRHLSIELSRNPPDCMLKLIALSAGCPPREPKFAPISFFNLFPEELIKERVGLFTEPLVSNADFARIRKESPWVKDAFNARDDIDIIVTSMGYVRDPEDKLSQLLEQCGVKRNSLEADGFLGNIQYRPFSASGPILGKDNDLRVVTLFEIEELEGFVRRKEKDIILIARRCSTCGLTKEEALLPMIEKFRVFTELVTDTATGTNLLNMQPKREQAPSVFTSSQANRASM